MKLEGVIAASRKNFAILYKKPAKKTPSPFKKEVTEEQKSDIYSL